MPTIDRLMVEHALALLSTEHRAVVWRSYYLGLTVARIAEDLQIAEGTGEVEAALCIAGAPGDFAGNAVRLSTASGPWDRRKGRKSDGG